MEVAVFAGPCSAGQQLDDGAAVWAVGDAGCRTTARPAGAGACRPGAWPLGADGAPRTVEPWRWRRADGLAGGGRRSVARLRVRESAREAASAAMVRGVTR